MFHILNSNLTPATPTVPTATPDVRFLELHGEHVLFDANSLCAVQTDKELFERIKTCAEARESGAEEADGKNVLDRLPFRGLLFSREKPQFRANRSAMVRRVVLNVTHACNLACVYCFVKDKPAVAAQGVERMSVVTAMKGAAMIAAGQPMDVAFFGGEPLLAWDLVREVTERVSALARERRVQAKFHITTNGTLLTEEILSYLKQVNCSLLVSLDGPEELHNAARPLRIESFEAAATGGGCAADCDTAGSFAAVMEGLRRAAAMGMGRRIMARGTFRADVPRLVERLEFLADLQDEGLINGYSVEPAVLGEGCAGRGERLDRELIRREYHAAAQWYLARLKAGKSADFFHFRKLGERIANAQHAGTECGAGNGYVTVAPDGTIHACHREGTPVGHVDYGFDEEARSAWAENRIYRRPACLKCWARYLCGGGCRQACLELGGRMNAATPDRCFLQQVIFEECIWLLTQPKRGGADDRA